MKHYEIELQRPARSGAIKINLNGYDLAENIDFVLDSPMLVKITSHYGKRAYDQWKDTSLMIERTDEA